MAATMTTTHMRACASTRTVRAARRVVVVPRATLRTDVKVPAAPERKASPSRQAPLAGFEIGFTPDNEVFVGRLAMLGFAGSVVGEALSGGQGALAQLGYDFGLGQTQVGLFLAGLVSFNLLASVLPGAATYRAAQQADEAAAAGPLQDPRITLLSGPAKFFGVTNWGFTPQNELFAGRVAQLGFLASILGELATGLGPVGQLSAETGVPAYAIQAALAAWASFMALTAVDKLTGRKGGSSQRGKTVKQRLLQLAAKPADA